MELYQIKLILLSAESLIARLGFSGRRFLVEMAGLVLHRCRAVL